MLALCAAVTGSESLFCCGSDTPPFAAVRAVTIVAVVAAVTVVTNVVVVAAVAAVTAVMGAFRFFLLSNGQLLRQ